MNVSLPLAPPLCSSLSPTGQEEMFFLEMKYFIAFFVMTPLIQHGPCFPSTS